MNKLDVKRLVIGITASLIAGIGAEIIKYFMDIYLILRILSVFFFTLSGVFAIWLFVALISNSIKKNKLEKAEKARARKAKEECVLVTATSKSEAYADGEKYLAHPSNIKSLRDAGFIY